MRNKRSSKFDIGPAGRDPLPQCPFQKKISPEDCSPGILATLIKKEQ